MLLPWKFPLFVFQHLQGIDQAGSGLPRLDNIIDAASLPSRHNLSIAFGAPPRRSFAFSSLNSFILSMEDVPPFPAVLI